MKSKQFNKKMTLNKKTVANLNNGEMREVNGGDICPHKITYQAGSCPTVCYTMNSDKSIVVCCAPYHCI
jgi:hypothetical protein